MIEKPEPTTTEDIDAAVERGVAWLDENLPDWKDRVSSPEILDHCNCVLAQLSKDGDFYDAKSEFDLTSEESIRLGFNMVNGYEQPKERWEYLQEAWDRALANDRQDAPSE